MRRFLSFCWGRLSEGNFLERKWWGRLFFAGKNQVGALVGRGNIKTGVKQPGGEMVGKLCAKARANYLRAVTAFNQRSPDRAPLDIPLLGATLISHREKKSFDFEIWTVYVGLIGLN